LFGNRSTGFKFELDLFGLASELDLDFTVLQQIFMDQKYCY
jgi:hypothetical protein